jgi:hypothetical protein
MLRHSRPKRVVELGSGYSTLVTQLAQRRSRDDRDSFEHRIFEPYPWLPGVEHEDSSVIVAGAVEVPLEEFTRLERGDVLFVDTTHTVKVGGEVIRIVNEILPTLQPGVLVHFHDIFTPWHYPRLWVESHFYWNEQYLLEAFLSLNDAFEVVLAAHALGRTDADRLGRSIPPGRGGAQAASFWLRSR